MDCPDCDGAGEVYRNPSWIGDPQCVESATCSTCRGDGAIEVVPCLCGEEEAWQCECSPLWRLAYSQGLT